MNNFPFPSKEQALEELRRDPGCRKIRGGEAEIQAIVDRAWDTGSKAAHDVYRKYGSEDVSSIVERYGITVERVPVDCVIGNLRYFSDYFSGSSKQIKLYTLSIEKWAGQNGLSPEEGEKFILAHELFHHLECTELGHTSRQYMVPMVVVGPLRLGSTGIRALSEIGAHAFARTLFELRGHSYE